MQGYQKKQQTTKTATRQPTKLQCLSDIYPEKFYVLEHSALVLAHSADWKVQIHPLPVSPPRRSLDRLDQGCLSLVHLQLVQEHH